MDFDEGVLRDVRSWGRDLDGFTNQHADNGLSYAQCVVNGVHDASGAFVEGVRPGDSRTMVLLAIDTACCALWIDDCFDVRVDGSSRSVDLPALVASATERPTTREGRGFHLLCARFRQEADSAAYELWVNSALDTFRAFHESSFVSSRAEPYSYAEHLQNGEQSIAVIHSMATISLICGFDMAARLRDPRVSRMLRNLSLMLRLENDLMSAEVERANKVRANAVLLLEELLQRAQAVAFVTIQALGYRRLLERDFEELGARDPLVKSARALSAATIHFYAASRARYTPVVAPSR